MNWGVLQRRPRRAAGFAVLRKALGIPEDKCMKPLCTWRFCEIVRIQLLLGTYATELGFKPSIWQLWNKVQILVNILGSFVFPVLVNDRRGVECYSSEGHYISEVCSSPAGGGGLMFSIQKLHQVLSFSLFISICLCVLSFFVSFLYPSFLYLSVAPPSLIPFLSFLLMSSLGVICDRYMKREFSETNFFYWQVLKRREATGNVTLSLARPELILHWGMAHTIQEKKRTNSFPSAEPKSSELSICEFLCLEIKLELT